MIALLQEKRAELDSVPAIRNPFARREVEPSRELVYAQPH